MSLYTHMYVVPVPIYHLLFNRIDDVDTVIDIGQKLGHFLKMLLKLVKITRNYWKKRFSKNSVELESIPFYYKKLELSFYWNTT